jgi:protein-S-isoprenylcysteine O-methyltransferase Ste14
MNSAQLSILALAVGCFASFTWSLKFFFKTPSLGTPVEMKRLQLLGGISMVFQLLVLAWPGNVQPELLSLLAAFMYAGSFAVFWWAIRANRERPLRIAFSKGAPEHFIKQGPYRIVRHPFYTSYTIAWIAGALASRNLGLALTAAVMFVFYCRAASLEERQFGDSSYAEEYDEYSRKTGRFLPKLIR